MKFPTLIDLALQVYRDRGVAPARLAARDAVIGGTIGAARLSDERAIEAWLTEQKQGASSDGASAGERASQLIRAVHGGLHVVGLLLGIATMVSSLVFSRPVNVVSFWMILIGSQQILLVLWVLAALPSRWLVWVPGGPTLQHAARLLGRVPLNLFLFFARRLSPKFRREMRMVADQLQGPTQWFGNLMRWFAVAASQRFALAFNFGLILSFVAISLGSDPTFGWRSTLLSSEQMHQLIQWLAWPFAALWPAAVPTLDEVAAVKFSSRENLQIVLDPVQRIAFLSVWSELWPFLFGSLCFYGLLPRVITLTISNLHLRRYRQCGWKSQLAVQSLLRRLRRERVISAGEVDESQCEDHITSEFEVGEAGAWSACGPIPVFQWAGIDWSEQQVRTHLGEAFRVDVTCCWKVGQADPARDREALSALANEPSPQRVVLLVEEWESPDADYLDFVRQLRTAVTPTTDIVLVLVDRAARSDADASEQGEGPRAESIWRAFFRCASDPYLSINRLAEKTGERAL